MIRPQWGNLLGFFIALQNLTGKRSVSKRTVLNGRVHENAANWQKIVSP